MTVFAMGPARFKVLLEGLLADQFLSTSIFKHILRLIIFACLTLTYCTPSKGDPSEILELLSGYLVLWSLKALCFVLIFTSN